jgi:hypothetical protein
VPDNGAQMYAWMYTLYNKALQYRPGVQILPVFITYSRPVDAAQWVVNSEPVCNDAIYRAAQPFAQWHIYVAGYVSWDRIPTSMLVQDGIHYSPRAYQVAAEQVYNGAAATYGWPKAPDACGLDGHRPGAGANPYTLCPAT